LQRKCTTFFAFSKKFLPLLKLIYYSGMPLRTIHLQKGDKVMIIAPAGRISAGSLAPAVACLERWGLQVLEGAHVYDACHQFAGADAQRAADLQAAVNHPEIKAVICARGGYGCSRIIDDVDFSPLLQHHKCLVGFSDITVLHARWNRLGLASIHGIMPGKFPTDGRDNESTESLRKALFGEPLRYVLPAHPLNQTGEVEAPLVGGNLALITHLIGSDDALNTDDRILFLEDVGEYLYALDRMMVQLQRSKKLSKIKGLVVGYFTDIKDSKTPFGASAYDIISAYAKNLHIPVCFGFPAGHEEPNLSLPFGRLLNLSVTPKQATLNFKL
jgi:muramoyltetrapeptide carboxypeptidase